MYQLWNSPAFNGGGRKKKRNKEGLEERIVKKSDKRKVSVQCLKVFMHISHSRYTHSRGLYVQNIFLSCVCLLPHVYTHFYMIDRCIVIKTG